MIDTKLILIVALMTVILGCNSKKTNDVSITVLADRTDSELILKPDIRWILKLAELDKFPNRAVNFRFQNIGNTDYNPVYTTQLSNSSFLDNKLERKVAIARFYKLIDTLFKKQNEQLYSYKKSSILKPLVTQFKHITSEKTSSKVVILVSDGYENSSLFNVYRNTDLLKLKTLDSEFIKRLQHELNIPNLKGVKLYMIHYPSSSKDNQTFTLIYNLYRTLFESYGLEIQIGIDNSLVKQ